MEGIKIILKPDESHNVTAESTMRLAESFAQDLIFGISKGTFLTLKHTSVGLGLGSYRCLADITCKLGTVSNGPFLS